MDDTAAEEEGRKRASRCPVQPGRYRKERLEQEYLAQEQALQEEQLHDLYQLGREANHMRHDMKIKLDTIYVMLEKEGYEEAKMCVRKLGAEWENRPDFALLCCIY